MSAVDVNGLQGIGRRLGDVVIDPAIWPAVLEEINTAIGGAGASLLQSDIETSDIPRSQDANELIKAYFDKRWHRRDSRAERAVPLLRRGARVITDQDIVTPEEMRTFDFYTEFLAAFKLQWFAAVGFWSGAALWRLSIQRTARKGPFDGEDKRLLGQLAQHLTDTATLSKAVGRAVLSGVTDGLNLVKSPALALDRFGCVLDANPLAERLFDDEVRVSNRRLIVRDQQARAALDSFADQLRHTPDTAALPMEAIVVRRRTKRPLIIRALPVDAAARCPFLGARVLLVFTDVHHEPGHPSNVLAPVFGLTPAEARLAAVIATGMSPEQAAEQLGIARETARNQLKAVFAKTNTHRQSQLVALLLRL